MIVASVDPINEEIKELTTDLSAMIPGDELAQ